MPSLRSALEDVRVGQCSPLSAGRISCAGSIPCERAPAVDTDSQRILQGVKIVLTETCYTTGPVGGM